ncbi:hypothetical protein BDF20DRAFT_894953 [Mycotypha africana]|uniref:uncharacterized protein n=1 Tax=Mycotypha africana TaxID=64632 RepID=UPI0023019B89|nr:uncharacterized protein BDF20DRAFT_894953 [Mycotypha africana]KAI8968199.1 hypothetical protein BDF20DRAFT_894953 [Mycotypha africana]
MRNKITVGLTIPFLDMVTLTHAFLSALVTNLFMRNSPYSLNCAHIRSCSDNLPFTNLSVLIDHPLLPRSHGLSRFINQTK